jgi:hypothetical protein
LPRRVPSTGVPDLDIHLDLIFGRQDRQSTAERSVSPATKRAGRARGNGIGSTRLG